MAEEIRYFYVGYSFIVNEGSGTQRYQGNMGMQFNGHMKKNMEMFQAAKELISKRFELETPDQVCLNLFEELEA